MWLDNQVFLVVSGQSSCPGPYLAQFKALPGGAHISQSRWFPAQGFLEGWQDILWAGISSLLLAPPEFSWLAFQQQQHVPYQDLLL